MKKIHTCIGASQENGSKASKVTIQGDTVVPEKAQPEDQLEILKKGQHLMELEQ